MMFVEMEERVTRLRQMERDLDAMQHDTVAQDYPMLAHRIWAAKVEVQVRLQNIARIESEDS